MRGLLFVAALLATPATAVAQDHAVLLWHPGYLLTLEPQSVRETAPERISVRTTTARLMPGFSASRDTFELDCDGRRWRTIVH